MSVHAELKFLLSQGWRLIGWNLIESPDGTVRTTDIEKAARIWRVKLKLKEWLDFRAHCRRMGYEPNL
jgi:hypothetical protein